MTTREWVEVAAKTIEEATQEGLTALGLTSADEAEIEVVQEPKAGFLGIGGQDARVIIRPKPKPSRRRRSRGRRGRGKDRSEEAPKERAASPKDKPTSSGKQTTGDRQDRRQPRRERTPRTESAGGSTKPMTTEHDEAPGPDRDEQAGIVKGFLEGLLDSLGLEGDVAIRVEDDTIHVDVTGSQTEALVGTKGATMSSVLELTRTVVQRKSQANARIRLDIAGYAARRREALQIYARRLADKVLEEGGEIMLEPMNAAERKIVHDAIVEIDGVRTFSEGQEPNRSVVISQDD